MHTEGKRPEPHFSAVGIRSLNSDRERSDPALDPGPWHLCSSVSICGFGLHGYGLVICFASPLTYVRETPGRRPKA